MAEEVDPRTEADAQIARALQIVCDAGSDEERRDYTPEELETLFFALGTAMVQLVKLPGGKEARERFYHNATDQLAKRGRTDLLEGIKESVDRRAQAKKILKVTFGDSVDLTPGTSGYAMFKLVEQELDDREKLRTKLVELAASLG